MKFSCAASMLIFFLVATASHADVTVKIENASLHSVAYVIDNFKYLDPERTWTLLTANSAVTTVIPNTSKFGYLSLQIKIGTEIVEDYTPSGTNSEVTILIYENAECLVNVSRFRGLLETPYSAAPTSLGRRGSRNFVR